MSKVKISSNLFLEVAELNRLVNFMTEDGYKRLLQSLVNNYGIVRNTNNTYFKPTKKSEGVVTINAGLAYDNNLDAIVLSDDLDLSVSNTGTKQWIVLSRAVTNYEAGTVSVTADGALTGVGTKFTEILRGQPNFPTKVKFNSSNNTAEYEVVSVTDDATAAITGILTAESGIKYSVIGTFTPGFSPASEDKEIYELDSYSITLVESASRPSVLDGQFILGWVNYTNGVMSVGDERVYCMLNEKYTQESEVTGISPITSLLRATVISGIDSYGAKSADIEMILEHGYAVSAYSLNSSTTSTIFQILSGSCNFYGSATIPDNVFDGWLLLNRNNMKYAVIEENVGMNLYLSDFDAEMIETNNDFVIVPNFSEIEYEVKAASNVLDPSIPFYFRENIDNPYTRLRVYSLFPSFGGADSVTLTIRYRFIDTSGKRYAFQNLATATFINTQGNSETLANSSFSVDMASIEPQAQERNYS